MQVCFKILTNLMSFAICAKGFSVDNIRYNFICERTFQNAKEKCCAFAKEIYRLARALYIFMTLSPTIHAQMAMSDYEQT